MKLPTNFSIRNLRNHEWVKRFKNFTNSSAGTSVIAKTIVGLIIWVCALIPTWIYLIVRWIANPSTFWQEFAIVVICMIVMGWIQVLLAIGGFVLSMAALFSDDL